MNSSSEKTRIRRLPPEGDVGAGQVEDVPADRGRGDLAEARPGGADRRPEHHHPMLERRAQAPLGVGEQLEPQHLLAHQDVVAVLQVDGAPEAHIDPVAALERRQNPPGQAGHHAGVPGGEVGILEQEVPLGPPDVDLVAQQVVGDPVSSIAVDDHQPKPDLLLPDPDGRRDGRDRTAGRGVVDHSIGRAVGGDRCGGRDRRRTAKGDFRQRFGGQPSPTELAKNDLRPVGVSAATAFDHVDGVCKGPNPLVTGGPDKHTRRRCPAIF